MDNHKALIRDLEKHFKPVLDNSNEGVYLWLDENHMIFNKKFATMFGYTPKEMQKISLFLDNFVAEKDQETFSMNYSKHIAKLSSPVRFRFHGVKKSGKTFLAETDMIPITFGGHAIAYHFVRLVK